MATDVPTAIEFFHFFGLSGFFGFSGLFCLFSPSEIVSPFHPVHLHYPSEITEAFHGAGRASGINFFGFLMFKA
jgi:hypothetical protein